VSLTQAGRILCAHAEAIFKSVSEAERDLAALAGVKGGEMRLASFPTASAALMPRAIARFRAEHPEVRVLYDELEPEDSLPRLLKGELDMAIVFDYELNPLDVDAELINLHPVLEEPLFIAMPRSHPKAGEETLGLKELRDEAWIGGNAFACNDSFIRLCIREGFQPKIVFGSDDYATVQGLIAQGMGVAMMPALATMTMLDELVAVPLCPRTVPRRVHAALPRGEYQLPASTALLKILVEVAPEALAKTAAGRRVRSSAACVCDGAADRNGAARPVAKGRARAATLANGSH
jgi:DNA-binding transcriptional LysR family regulator